MDAEEKTNIVPSNTALPKQNAKKSDGIAGLVLGILSILLCWTVIISLILSILALVFSVKQRKTNSTIPSIIGIITAIIGIVFSIFFLGLFVIVGMAGAIPGMNYKTNSDSLSLSNAYWSTAPVGLKNVIISTTAQEWFTLSNNQANVISITSLKFNNIEMLSNGAITLAPGESSGRLQSDFIGPSMCPEGKTYSFPVVINYKVDSIEKTLSGHNIVGKCEK